MDAQVKTASGKANSVASVILATVRHGRLGESGRSALLPALAESDLAIERAKMEAGVSSVATPKMKNHRRKLATHTHARI